MYFQFEFPRLLRPVRAVLLAATALSAVSGSRAHAQAVQVWTGNADNVFDNAANWTLGPVPGALDTAQFDGVTGNANAVRNLVQGVGVDASVRQIDVTSGAGAYSLDTSGNRLDIGQTVSGGISVGTGASFTIANTGGGVVAFDNQSTVSGALTINSSGFGSGVDFLNGSNAGSAVMTFGLGSNATFRQNSTAGNASITAGSGTLVFFFNDSLGGNSTIVSNGSSRFEFTDNANAQNANITVNGALGEFRFWGASSAGNANITINNGLVSFGQSASAHTATAANANIDVVGGVLTFEGNTTAGDATIFVSSAGAVGFGDNATGGNARFVLASDGFGGLLDFSVSAGAGGLGIVTAGSIEGGGLIRIGGANALFRVGGNNLSTEFSGEFCECFGPGALEKVGTGTLILSGTNTYTGTTTISQGVLQIGSGGTTGSVAGNILNNSVLAINRSDNFDFANNISGAGALNHIGTGITTLTGNNIYTGATNVISGTLQAGGVNAFGTGSAVTVIQGATLSLNNFNQTIGSLAGGGGVSLGNAVLTAGDATDTNFSGVISGSGSVVKQGSGVWTLTGANTFTGGTTVNAGTLQLGDGGTTGSVLGPIVNNSILSFNRADSFTLANAITGTGTVQFDGFGTVTIADTQNYTGTTAVNGGGLIVNGSIGSSQRLTIANNTFVGGTGVLPSVTVNGTLAPGNSIGTITVQGNLTMGAGGTYAVEFDGANSDVTAVTGAAALAGQVQALPVGGNALVPRNYTILSAGGGISGTFSAIDRSLIPAAFGVSLSYSATEVTMSLSSALSQLSGLNRNQRAIGTGIDASLNAGAALNSGFVTLLNLPGAALPGALTQLSGEVATGAPRAGFQIMDQYLALLLNPFAEGRSGGAFGPASAGPMVREFADAYAAGMPTKASPLVMPQRWSVWGAAYGAANRTDGEPVAIGSHDIDPRGYGFAAGADYRPAPGTLLGFSLAGGGTSWSLSGGLGSGKTDVFQTGAYGSRQFGAAYVSAALAYAWHDGTTDRTVTVASSDMLRGEFRADSFGGRIEGGYRFGIGPSGSGLTPYAALQGQSFRTSGFGETVRAGSAQFALNYGDQTSTAVRTELGAWADGRFGLANGNALALRGRLAWAHDEVTGARIGAVFQALPGSAFTVLGAEAPSNLALVTAGAELRLRNGVSVGAKFEGEFASRSRTYGGAGTVRYAW